MLPLFYSTRFMNYFLDFDDFIAIIIIKEMLIYRQQTFFLVNYNCDVQLYTQPYEYQTRNRMTKTIIINTKEKLPWNAPQWQKQRCTPKLAKQKQDGKKPLK